MYVIHFNATVLVTLPIITLQFSFYLDMKHFIPIFCAVLIFAALISEASAATNSTSSRISPSASATSAVKTPRSEYHHYDHGYVPHNHYGHFKDLDHYLMPMVVLLGAGVLLLPLLTMLMTGLTGNVPVTTLVSGRKKRSAFEIPNHNPLDLITKIEKAIELFNKLRD